MWDCPLCPTKSFSALVASGLSETSINIFIRHPFAVDLSPCDLFLLQKLERNMQRWRFATESTDPELQSSSRCWRCPQRKWSRCFPAVSRPLKKMLRTQKTCFAKTRWEFCVENNKQLNTQLVFFSACPSYITQFLSINVVSLSPCTLQCIVQFNVQLSSSMSGWFCLKKTFQKWHPGK